MVARRQQRDAAVGLSLVEPSLARMIRCSPLGSPAGVLTRLIRFLDSLAALVARCHTTKVFNPLDRRQKTHALDTQVRVAGGRGSADAPARLH